MIALSIIGIKDGFGAPLNSRLPKGTYITILHQILLRLHRDRDIENGYGFAYSLHSPVTFLAKTYR